MELSEWENQPLSRPLGEASNPSGFAGSSLNLGDLPAGGRDSSSRELSALSTLATQAMEDPVLFERLCDRVYALMLDDLRQWQERSRSYGRLW